MGHSHSKNNEKDSAPQYIPDFEVVRMIESHNYGRVKLVRDTKTGTHMILREFLFDNKQAFEKEVKSFEEKGVFEHPNIIQIVGYYTTEANTFCSRFFKVAVFIEQPHDSLESEIKERTKSGLKYNDEEILTVADNIVSALSHLEQTKDLCHGDIRPANIYTSGQNYKITDPKLEVDQNANMLIKAIINNSKAYLSPALLKQVPTRQFELTEDKHKADVFALGATLLHMATLKDNDELYCYETGEFYEAVLHHRLHHVQHYYSPFTFDLIRDMLEVDEHHRPCLNDLRQRLAGFSHDHHHHHECESRGWEQGRFKFVGEAGDEEKLVSWKYKQEFRLGYEQKAREENVRKKAIEDELEHTRKREQEHHEMHKKKIEEHREIIQKKSHEEKEHVVKAFVAPHVHEEDHHHHHIHEHKEVSHEPLALSSHRNSHITEPISMTPTHHHQHQQAHLDHAFLSARSVRQEEEERESARRKRDEEHHEFMRRMENELRGFEKKKEHEEHALRSAPIPQVKKEDYHIHEYTHAQIQPIQPQQQLALSSNVTSHTVVPPISIVPTHNVQTYNVPTHNHQEVRVDNTFLSEEEKELARKQEDYREFLKRIDQQISGLEKIKTPRGEKEHVVKSARLPEIQEEEEDHHFQEHRISQIQPQQFTQPISATPTYNQHHIDWDNTASLTRASAQPNNFVYTSTNIHQQVESPVRSSYNQGNYDGALGRDSYNGKQLSEHSFEENVASYNYALGGSPLKQRNTRSTNLSVKPDALNQSFGTNDSPQQGYGNFLDDLKQFNLAQSQAYTPVHHSVSLNGQMATSIHAPGRNIY